MNTKIAPTDLTQRPPRSFHVRLGSLVILPRMLDKGRATLVKKNGEYSYNSSTDQHLVRFLGFDPEALLKEIHRARPRPLRLSRRLNALVEGRSRFRRMPPMPTPSVPRSKRPSRLSDDWMYW